MALGFTAQGLFLFAFPAVIGGCIGEGPAGGKTARRVPGGTGSTREAKSISGEDHMSARQKSNRPLQILALAVLSVMLWSVAVHAEKIIWVSGNLKDADGIDWDQPFVDVLEANGYEVQRENDTMTGTAFTEEQLAVLEDCDLVIVSRSTSSGNYNNPTDWNSLMKPLICTSCYLSRLSRWKWSNSDALLGDGNSGCPAFHAENPDHPIFSGVTLDENGNVAALDGTIGSGNTSLANWKEYGEAELIATVADTGTIAIVYWAQDVDFFPDGDQFAAGPRLLFQCGSRESTLSPVDPAAGQGMYNLTPEGEKMFLNAVAFMLGKDTGVQKGSPAVPTAYSLAQNFPNPFNPSTRIEFSLPATARVNLCVVDMLGQEIATLLDQSCQAGTHRVAWNGLDRSGKAVRSGVYIYRLETEHITLTKKMLLIR